jgi:hypothetical protein
MAPRAKSMSVIRKFQADNVTVHVPSGDVFVAEDGGNLELCILSSNSGVDEVAPFLRFIGHDASEVTGPAFSPDHKRLYVSSQRGSDGINGRTYEITGPFRSFPFVVQSGTTTTTNSGSGVTAPAIALAPSTAPPLVFPTIPEPSPSSIASSTQPPVPITPTSTAITSSTTTSTSTPPTTSTSVAPKSSLQQLPVVAGTFVRGGLFSKRVFSANKTIEVRSSTPSNARTGLLAFDSSLLSERAGRVELRLFVQTTSASRNSLRVHALRNPTWAGRPRNWLNSPRFGELVASLVVQPSTSGQWVTIDVTQYVMAERAKGSRVICFGLKGQPNAPRLEVDGIVTTNTPALDVRNP